MNRTSESAFRSALLLCASAVMAISTNDSTAAEIFTDNGVTDTATDDDNSDGLCNLNEYAFGRDPTSGSSVNPITAQLDKATGTLSYSRHTQSLSNLLYSVRSSSTLALKGWTTLVKGTDYTETVYTSGEVETVIITLTPAPTTDKLFLQVMSIMAP
jgi:hypothetical protein